MTANGTSDHASRPGPRSRVRAARPPRSETAALGGSDRIIVAIAAAHTASPRTRISGM